MNEKEILLIKRSQKGDVDAFEELISDNTRFVYNIALKMLKNKEDAEDISQEALIKVYKNIDSFNMASSFKTWMYRIVVNTCLDHMRKNKVTVLSIDKPIITEHNEFQVEIEDKSFSPEELFEKKENQKLIIHALNQLDDSFKAAIILRDINDFSYEEIADILTCNLGTVKSRISRGRQKLREIIEKDETINLYGIKKII
ncbi:MAG: sigma-70 family RNA polymerase sigma factor [Eubacteriales bacterium]|nr:sigma-70 family RNA polymerase sigma factor [Eubacteriales bacterium]